MEQLKDYFYITTTDNHLSALIHCNDAYKNRHTEITEETLLTFLKENQITNGIDNNNIQLMTSVIGPDEFPIIIASGTPAEHGEHGDITYKLDFSAEIVKSPDWNFRDVMRIPTVIKGQKLATLIMPTDGENGIDVYGNPIQAKPGKPSTVKAGKNVVYREKDHSYYAAADGQVRIVDGSIQVRKVYEINESLSMKSGNLDFVGTIVIHGDVPTGYTVKAKGDIKVFGMVEAATISAGGSIFISEGLAGLGKGVIKAEENIHIGYINQGYAHAGKDLYVENSILHSECTAADHLYCQRGNIIGGSISAGKSVEAKDIGNRMNTKTEVIFGINKTIYEKEKKLIEKKEELQQALEKLSIIGKKLEAETEQNNTKMRITLLRQRNSHKKATEELQEVEKMLNQLNAYLGSEYEALLFVKGQIFANVLVTFGKYKRKITTNRQNVQLKLEQNEIQMRDT